MKVNSRKSHLLISGNKAIANIDNNRTESEDIFELPGITIDSKMTFEIHINPLLRNIIKCSHTLKILQQMLQDF